MVNYYHFEQQNCSRNFRSLEQIDVIIRQQRLIATQDSINLRLLAIHRDAPWKQERQNASSNNEIAREISPTGTR